MTKIAVIFDTSATHTKRTKQSFFGQHAILEEISQRATILMPQVVIDELIQQNIEGTTENITNLKENPLLPTLGFDISSLDKIVSHEHAHSLMLADELKYETVDIKDKEIAFEKMRRWVITGNPPFNERRNSGSANSDKGFKDALIACTIDELLDENAYDKYYLACIDGRLKEYYANNQRIRCLSPGDIANELAREFFDDYTIDVIRKEIGIEKAKLKKSWPNLNLDIVAQFESEEDDFYVILDANTKEILGYSNRTTSDTIENLITSNDYDVTHIAVAELIGDINYSNEEQLKAIKDAFLTNDKIYNIGNEEDVKALASIIFAHFKEFLSEDDKQRFSVYYELKDL